MWLQKFPPQRKKLWDELATELNASKVAKTGFNIYNLVSGIIHDELPENDEKVKKEQPCCKDKKAVDEAIETMRQIIRKDRKLGHIQRCIAVERERIRKSPLHS